MQVVSSGKYISTSPEAGRLSTKLVTGDISDKAHVPRCGPLSPFIFSSARSSCFGNAAIGILCDSDGF